MAGPMDRKAFEDNLWAAVKDARAGMLGLMNGQSGHFQPMTAYLEPERRAIWFFARRDNDVVKGAHGGARAMFTVVDKDQKVWACLGGEVSEQHDRDRIERYWTPVAAAWFPEGKDDPELTLVRFDVDDAQVWVAQEGPVRFAYEIAKANMTKTEPDVGETAHLRFN